MVIAIIDNNSFLLTYVNKLNNIEIFNYTKKIDILILNKKLNNCEINITSYLKSSTVVIANGDIENILKNVTNVKQLITYGLNSKCSITVSSVNDNTKTIQVCIQRQFLNTKNHKVLEQEFPIKSLDIYNTLIIVSLYLFCSININNIKHLF